MTYIQGTDFISDTAEVRRLARNVVTGDFSDAQIQNYQYYEYSFIRTITNKDDWDSADREYGALKEIETEAAAAEIIRIVIIIIGGMQKTGSLPTGIACSISTMMHGCMIR